MKKILSFILAALMTASCAAYVAADDAAVEATASNAEQDYAIEFLKHYKIFKGYSADETGAENAIERYQMALFVSRISTGWTEDEKWEDGTANNATFKDIEEGAAANYLGAISYANQNGIIEGYTANTFAPYDGITYRDALTMVVRTLGYKGLTYPWGYIEKAVELDLTKGIGSDVAYTEDLTRGEVAMIIYNAMFAKTATGSTLAKDNFGCEFAWQNIIVVSTDEYTTVYDKDGNGKYADKDYIGFKTVSENAEIGDKIYYVKAEDMGLLGHDAERAVGSVYIALFEAVDGNFVTLVDSNSLLTDVVFNNGITDNAGVAYGDDMPIAKYLKDGDYVTVKSYTNDKVNYDYADLKVFGYGTHEVYDEDGNVNNVGIDIATGNILKWVACDEDTHGKDDHVCGWVNEWFWNDTLQRYYQYVVDTENKKADKNDVVYTSATGNVYINWMSEKEFNDWYKDVVTELIASYSELQLLDASATVMLEGKAPYAKLALFDIDNDDKAEVANYKTYAIGKFSTVSKKCATCNADKPAYQITDLDDGNGSWAFVEDGHVDHDTDKTAGFAWVTVDDSVSGFENEDGTYNDGVVLYNWNKTTGEIEIVKYITEKATDDADSYIVTGILQGYNTAKQTVTISGVNYPIAYANLEGDMYKMADTKIAAQMLICDAFDAQYMQYVKAVVCDGYVVDTDLVGNTNAAIVVLGYAGITSDGYIAVYGYRTDKLALDTFKINSFNGWKQGDYRYNPTNAEDDGAFDFGSLYEIKSYDKETDSYGVYTENVENVLAAASPVQITFKKGYRSVQPMSIVKDNSGYSVEEKKDSTPTIVAMNDADKYVLIDGLGNIFVHSGIITDARNQEINGLMVGDTDSKYIVVYSYDNLDIPGLGKNNENNRFNTAITENAYDIGFVLYEKGNGKVLNAAYDEAIGDWYLLGSTESEVTVFNLLTGTYNVVLTSTNIDLVNGHIYKTYGGKILQDVTDKCGNEDSATFMHDFINTIGRNYASEDIDYADYIVKPGRELRKEDIVDAKGNKTFVELAFDLGLVRGRHTDKVNMAIANKLVTDWKVIKVTDDLNWNLYANHGTTSVADGELEDGYTYYADMIYDVKNHKVVIYIYDGVAGKADAKADDATKPFEATLYEGGTEEKYDVNKAWSVKINDKERYFDIATKYSVLATYEDKDCRGPVKSMKLTGIEMTLVEVTVDKDGKPTFTDIDACGEGNELHDALAGLGMCFGNEVTIGKDTENVIINDFYFDVDDDEVVVSRKDCGLTYKVVIDLTKKKGKKIDIDVEDQETVLNIVVANITGTITLTHNFAIDTTNGAEETPVFTGFNGTAGYKRIATDDVYRLEYKALVDDTIVIW